MTYPQPYTVSELALAFVTFSGGLSALMLSCWRSKCSKISVLYGLIQCDRVVESEVVLPSTVNETTL
jgi:hypothetical protein